MNTHTILKEVENDIIIRCRIQPSASKTDFLGIYDGALKFSLAAPPVDGKANKALCTFLAKKLRIQKSAVQIHSGAKSRLKTVKCKNITTEKICKIFDLSSIK